MEETKSQCVYFRGWAREQDGMSWRYNQYGSKQPMGTLTARPQQQPDLMTPLWVIEVTGLPSWYESAPEGKISLRLKSGQMAFYAKLLWSLHSPLAQPQPATRRPTGVHGGTTDISLLEHKPISDSEVSSEIVHFEHSWNFSNTQLSSPVKS